MTDPEERRRAIRRFVREHHPDRGGDPEAFAEGLRRLREGRPTTGTTVVEAHRSRGPIATLSRSYQRWRRRRRRARPTGRVQ
jgi:hypothetical protein